MKKRKNLNVWLAMAVMIAGLAAILSSPDKVYSQEMIRWQREYGGIVNGQYVSDAYSEGLGWPKPAFIDIDSDGDYDMFVGERKGNINFYRNDGTSTSLLWTFITDSYNSIDVGYGAVPTFCDIDNDGDYDMFVGEGEGGISFWRNMTTEGPRNFYVDDNAAGDPGLGDPTVSDPLEDGTQAHPFDAIQEAIDAAWHGDTVIVFDGTYIGNGNRDIDFNGRTITVRSQNGPENCVIDCEGEGRGFYFHNNEDADSILDGFTISNGYADYGGGIYCGNDSGPTINNCNITNNSGSFGHPGCGGGVYGCGGPIINCTISANTAWSGGGLGYCGGPITNCTISGNTAKGPGGGLDYCRGPITDCTISGNSAHNGGGISNGGVYRDGCKTSLINCTFSRNFARDTGGGMYNFSYHLTGYHPASATLINCIFSGNSAVGNNDSGGGIFNYSSSMTLTNCVFSGNSALWGGGMYNNAHDFSCTQVLTNCIFIGNWAGSRGGGIYNLDGNLTLINCILWYNTDTRGLDRPEQIVGSAAVSYSNVQDGWLGDGNIDVDPYFVSSGYWDANGVWFKGDYHLLPDSPCIDAGDPNYPYDPNETDLDGKPRVIGGRIDMGAFEYSPSIPAETRIVPRTINLASKGKWIACYICLPKDCNVADIDPNSVFLEDEIQAESLSVDEQEEVTIAKFSRSEVQGILNVGQVELTITGQLIDGTVFEGTDVIRVIDKGRKK